MKRVFALSALLCVSQAVEDVPQVCRLGEDFADDGSPCQAGGDVLIQKKSKISKHNPGEGGDPPPEALENPEYLEAPDPRTLPRSTAGQIGTFVPGAGVILWGRASCGMCTWAKGQLSDQGIAYEDSTDMTAMWGALNAIGHSGGVGIPVCNVCNEIYIQPGGSGGITMGEFVEKARTCVNSQSGPPPPPTPAPALSVQGPCVMDDAGCVTSPNFPSNYGNNERCTIGPNFGEIAVAAFDTENGWDKLFVDGTTYMGGAGPDGVNSIGDITWASDGSVVKGGWKLCSTAPATTVVPVVPTSPPDAPCTGDECNIGPDTPCTGDECNIGPDVIQGPPGPAGPPGPPGPPGPDVTAAAA